MERELRFKIAGLLFYMAAGTILVSTTRATDFIRLLAVGGQSNGYLGPVVAAVGVGAAIFTSEAVGFIFNALPLGWWRVFHGGFYPGEWRTLTRDPKQIVKSRCDSRGEASLPDALLGNTSSDVFLSFLWQQGPQHVVDWVTRRYTAFHTGFASSLGIWLGCALSASTVVKYDLGGRYLTWTIFAVWVLVGVVLMINAQYARRDARQMVDLWLAGEVDPNLRYALSPTMRN
jgi:hypothetical protein